MTGVTAMQAKSNDTDNRYGRIVGVEDAGESARRKCVNCHRPVGEVAG